MSGPGALPTLTLSRLWHVGDLVAGAKRRGSYEGAGLSVSLHPAAWRMIARGHVAGTTWEMRRPGARFLDALALTDAQRDDILARGIADEHVRKATIWRWTYFDDELDEEVHQEFASEAEAKLESGLDDGEEAVVVGIPGHASTPELDTLCLQDSPTIGTRATLDLLLPLHAEALGLDGVWWSERLDPTSLSAPRGVIPASRLEMWRRTAVKADPDKHDH